MIKEAIILAGGLGTRLRDTVPDLPKCMAPVAGHPFLFYVIDYLRKQGVMRFIFSLGYKHESVIRYLEADFPDIEYTCVVENKPLQTGGAIRLALKQASEDHVLIMNGDTLFRVNLNGLFALHLESMAECTLALKPMQKFDRYGAVLLQQENRIQSFEEKKYVDAGFISGGVYVLNRELFLAEEWPEVFSFETGYLAKNCATRIFSGYTEDAYFIDIGIPEDYERAQFELKAFTFPFDQIDSSWTLFLDRDGVINMNKDDSYVFSRDEFIFKEGVLQAFPYLSDFFLRVIVLTNQRGIGRGMMSENDLEDIHAYMLASVTAAGGRIDEVFYCTAVHDDNPFRKPNPGMGLKAKEKYPEIDLTKSIMVGDKASDMKLGRNLGAKTVLINSDRYKRSIRHDEVDLYCGGLQELMDYLQLRTRDE